MFIPFDETTGPMRLDPNITSRRPPSVSGGYIVSKEEEFRGPADG
jgi:hypothetical protein